MGKPANGRGGLKAYDPEACKLFDDFYSGRIEIGKAALRRQRFAEGTVKTNPPPANAK